MSFAKIKRRAKQNKTLDIKFRVTKDEYDELHKMKEALQFDKINEMIFFCTDVVKMLHEWKLSNYSFFVGKPEEDKSDIKEVEFEFRPNFK
jgi:hypothetical protein